MEQKFDLDTWVAQLLSGLKSAFGNRILFAAHAGSWVRGEAKPSSDIDINIVLDEVLPKDVETYRSIVAGMPFREKACGFICGKAEMKAWPRHELFHFMNGCRMLHRSLDGIIEPPSKKEVAEYLRINASGILHLSRHTLIYSNDLSAMAEGLAPVYKSAFFILQAKMFILTGEYVPSRKVLLPLLDDRLDREVFETCAAWDSLSEERGKNPEKYFKQLEEWSSGLLLLADKHARL